MTSAHSEWTVDRAALLLQHAILAPSSHNTQPWRFRVHDTGIDLYADRTRALPVNDPDDRELAISCGCALFNLRVAAANAGFSSAVRLLPDENNPDFLASVSLRRTGDYSRSEAELFPAIERRRTYRRRFDTRQVPEDVLRELSDAAEQERAWLIVLAPDSMRREASALVAAGDAMQWANPSWRRELAAWMRPRRRGDGLTMPGMVAPVVQMVVRMFDMGNNVGAKDKQLAEESPVLAVLGTDQDGPGDWIGAGQALERVLLKACQCGLQGSFLNQPIQVAFLRPKLRHLLGTSGFPQILLRLGFPVDDLPAVPRRPLPPASR